MKTIQPENSGKSGRKIDSSGNSRCEIIENLDIYPRVSSFSGRVKIK